MILDLFRFILVTSTAHYRELPPTIVNYRRLQPIAILKLFWIILITTTANYRQLPSTTANYRQLSLTTADRFKAFILAFNLF
jgi:hypothetical protein